MRVLMLATYFPKPLNPLMGNWALAQAQAIRRHGVEVEVISLTAHVPILLARTSGLKAYACCPRVYDWDGLVVHYPRWPVYPDQATRGLQFRNPQPFLNFGWIFARASLGRHVERIRPDVIFAHHTAVNGWLAFKLNQMTGLPYLVTDHDFDEISACRAFPARRTLFAKVCANASMMVSVASRMERELLQLFPGAKTRTIPNGTNPIPPKYAALPRTGSLAGKTILFSCGHFFERKNFPFLVAAFATVAGRHPDAILRIAGDGQTRPLVESEVRKHGLENRVQLLGRLPHSKVLGELVSADAFVLPSRDEPFATVYSEAASAGKPMLVGSDGGFCDVFQDGVHGYAVAPDNLSQAANALDRLLSSPAERLRMGEAVKQLFETRLRWEHNAAAMIEVFEQAIWKRKIKPATDENSARSPLAR